ncbi:MAG TPA: 50S ribosomal protein L24 [Candidatus Saccharimonadales bacterium]
MKLVKGDNVVILSGRHRGQTGKVSRLLPKEAKVLIDGLNLKTKHLKPKSKQPGGREKIEHPLPISKVALVRPGKQKLGSRVGFKLAKDGQKTRVYRQAGNKEVKS